MATQQSGTTIPTSRLNRSSLLVSLMCRASFNLSMSCLFALSIIFVLSQRIGWCSDQACSAMADYKLLTYTLAHVKMSLHIELYYLNGSRATGCLITTHPHLHIISSRGGEVFNKPWRSIEGTASVSRTTPPSIPERVRRLQSKGTVS